MCIHLDPDRNEFKFNKEAHLKPILATGIIDGLFGEGVEKLADDKFNLENRHLNTLTDLIAKDLKIDRDQIVDFELTINDAQPAQLIGLHDEFVSAARLDNLASSFTALDAIIQQAKTEPANRENAEIDMLFLFDHEEIGS